jgi:hypothetical protein
MRYQGKVVHLVCSRLHSDPTKVRWYVRYVWISADRVTRDTVLADGQLDWAQGSARDVVRACLTAALDELQGDAGAGVPADRD